MKYLIWLSTVFFLSTVSCAQQTGTESASTQPSEKKVNEIVQVLTEVPPLLEEGNYNQLTEFETYVIAKKGTERSYTGAYHDSKKEGVYICRRCNLELFSSDDKFDSRSGWPSFDDEIKEGVVKEVTDADGYRTEILCGHCDGHLGHVFKNEGMTKKQTRHCVNSASIQFVEGKKRP